MMQTLERQAEMELSRCCTVQPKGRHCHWSEFIVRPLHTH